MTNTQKQQIEYLRGRGESYAKIAGTLGLSENTVKSYCRRSNTGAVIKHGESGTADKCANCSNPLTHTPGSRRKHFCSYKCRMAWWKAHPEAVNRKAVYNFICPACGKSFTAYGNARRKYCSRACSGIARKVSDGQK